MSSHATDTMEHRLAIMGLTYQYTTSRISRAEYDKYHPIFYDEVFRLNPPATAGSSATTSLHPDDSSIRATDELRFLLFRHWNLYDAMYHSSYVAGKLGIWRERGKKKLSGLLAKMGWVPFMDTLVPELDHLLDSLFNKRSNHISTWTWT